MLVLSPTLHMGKPMLVLSPTLHMGKANVGVITNIAYGIRVEI